MREPTPGRDATAARTRKQPRRGIVRYGWQGENSTPPDPRRPQRSRPSVLRHRRSYPTSQPWPRPVRRCAAKGVAARADGRKKLERLCRYISRPAVAEKRLSLTPNGNVRYDVNGVTDVAGAGMRKRDPAEDPLARRHYARHLRTPRFHRPAGGLGAQATRQSHSFARDIRAE